MGSIRTISLGRSQRNIAPAAVMARTGVLDAVAASPIEIKNVGIHQRKVETLARARARGSPIANKTPSAIGCWADPMARMTPVSYIRTGRRELHIREDGAHMVEHVEPRSLLEYREERDDGDAANEKPGSG